MTTHCTGKESADKILATIEEAKGWISRPEIRRRTNLSEATVKRHITFLEELQLIQRWKISANDVAFNIVALEDFTKIAEKVEKIKAGLDSFTNLLNADKTEKARVAISTVLLNVKEIKETMDRKF